MHFTGMVRFPCFWEEGTWLRNVESLELPTIETLLFSPGITILSVHPMHMVMNSPDFGYARRVKDQVSREEWSSMDELALNKVKYPRIW